MVGMIHALALLLGMVQAPDISLTPSDDVWVYSHASDPAHDAYLRAFGSDTKSVAASMDEQGDFSYGFLKFDLSAVKPGWKLASATLTLTHIGMPSFTKTQGKQNPLEVRPMVGDFNEKTWAFDQVEKTHPLGGEKDIFGSFALSGDENTDKDWTLSIDLLKGPASFSKAIDAAAGKSICLALVSKLSPAEGAPATWKVYSKDADSAAKRPQLVLKFEKEASR